MSTENPVDNDHAGDESDEPANEDQVVNRDLVAAGETAPERLSTPPVIPLKDLEPGRDVVRAVLALSLVSLLVVVVVGAGVVVALNKDRVSAMDEFLKVVLTPVVGLVGSAVGFYFGAGAGPRRDST